MLEDADLIVPSPTVLTQSSLTNDPQVIVDALNQYWNGFWQPDLDKTQQDWSTFEQLIADVPQLPVCDIRVNDLALWRESLQKAPAHTAVGVDGWYVQELKDLPDPQLQALIDIFQLWRDSRVGWPASLMQARTVPLGKTDQATTAEATRPITILATLYRVWVRTMTMQILRHWAVTMPQEVVGFLPGRSLVSFLWEFQYELETIHSPTSDGALVQGGLTLDLRKCFNTLHHVPVKLAMLRAGVPPDVADQWEASVSVLTRVWDLHGNLYPGSSPQVGCAEGDTFSVVACLAVCYLWVSLLQPTHVRAFAYADNWGWRSPVIAQHEAALDATVHFTSLLHLSIDWAKTWAWSTDHVLRGQWAQLATRKLPLTQFQIVPSARELGFQLHYGKTHRRHTQRQRHALALDRLSRLAHLDLEIDVKAKIANDAANTMALYGTEIYHVGHQWTSALRTAITRALVPKRPHANPYLATMILSPRLIDPELHLIVQSIRSARRVLWTFSLDRQQSFFRRVARHNRKELQVRGPAGALSLNLARIGWQLDKHGNIHTDNLLHLHLLTSSLVDIQRILTQSWMTHISQVHLLRQPWRMLPPVDRTATLTLLDQLPSSQRHIVNRDLVGAYYTTPQKEHADVEDTHCPFCGQEEDDDHRLWLCPATQHVRDQHPTVMQAFRDSDPCVTRLPVCFRHPDMDFQQVYLQERPAPEWVPESCDQIATWAQQGYHLRIWTDGSCASPSEPEFRRSAFAIVTHPPTTTAQEQDLIQQYRLTRSIPPTFCTLAVGEVDKDQTINRAELLAVYHVVGWFLDAALPGTLHVYTDSSFVLQQIAMLRSSTKAADFQQCSHFDVLLPLWHHLQAARVEFHKVAAHQIDRRPEHFEFEHLGNEAADTAAKAYLAHLQQVTPLPLNRQAVQHHRAMLRAWYAYLQDLQFARALLQAGKTAQPSQPTERSWQTRRQTLDLWSPSLEIFEHPAPPDEQACHACLWGTTVTRDVISWLQNITWEANPAPLDQGIGTTWFELTYAYLVLTGNPLPINIGGQRDAFRPQLVMPTDRDVQFGKLVTSFQRLVTQIETLTDRCFVPPGRAQIRHLTYLGAAHSSKGITTRSTYDGQTKVWDHMQAYFLARSLAETNGQHGFPGYPAGTMTPRYVLHQHDLDDFQQGWITRFQRHVLFTRRRAKPR
eukprot:Skav227432  [mRNA]  locus=scaffold203:91253:94780:+ [translate_table: standard]